MEKTKSQKKRVAIIATVVCLALAAGLGTYAWLSAQSSLTNTFTVGSINQPDKKPDPDQPDKPGTDDWNVDGNLIETNWIQDSKLVPGGTVDKNPNVGLGAGSDNSYVFVYVKNALVNQKAGTTDTPYFTINDGWKAVDAQTNGTAGQYVSGLFMYATDGTVPALLNASESSDVYTGELFSKVIVPSTLTKDMVNTNDQGKADMVVSCYIFGDGQQGDKASAAENALAQAKSWAETQK